MSDEKEVLNTEDGDEDNEYQDLDNSQQETEEDLRPVSLKDVSQVVVYANDWTTETILSQLKRGNIQLNPKFQRRDAWNVRHKSRFIESLIMGLPIPQLVLAEQKNQRGRYVVIDGKQRLLSLRQFAASPEEQDEYEQLKLTGLEIKTELNGLTLKDLEHKPELYDDFTAFQNQPIRTVVVRNWSQEDFLYLLFLRLNTGSVKLSPQELRQALKPGPFTSFAEEVASNSKGLKLILNSKKPDFRMRDVELLIRYYAFSNFIEEYTGNLKTILDLTCERFNQTWEGCSDQLKVQSEAFEKAIETTYRIFGNNAFRKWNGTQFETKFNRAVFDVMIFYFARNGVGEQAVDKADMLEQNFKEMCTRDREFKSSLETTTKSIKATFTRLSGWGKILNNNGVRVPTIHLENDRIVVDDGYGET